MAATLRDEALRIYGEQLPPTGIEPLLEQLFRRFGVGQPAPASPDGEITFQVSESERRRFAKPENREDFFSDRLSPGERAALYRYLLSDEDAMIEHRRLRQALDKATGGKHLASPRRRSQIERRNRSRAARAELPTEPLTPDFIEALSAGKVRVLTYYGLDNQIDGIVLNVLISKHKKIRSSLGISVPVPVDTDQVIEAIFEGLLLRGKKGTAEEQMLLFEDFMKPKKDQLYGQWDAATEREKRSRTVFAQETIKVEEVARELQAVRAAIGSGVHVAAFTKEALRACRAVVTEQNGAARFDLAETPRALKETLQEAGNLSRDQFTARFELPVKEGQLHLNRTHPLVEGLSAYLMETALDPLGGGPNAFNAHRCGVIRTSRVIRRTTLLLLRFRYHIITRRGDVETPLLAEDCQALAFAGAPQSAEWLDAETAESLLAAEPDANITPEQQTDFIRKVIDGFDALRPRLNQVAEERGAELLEAHRRVRVASHAKGVSHRVEPQMPPDVLGIFVYLPKG